MSYYTSTEDNLFIAELYSSLDWDMSCIQESNETGTSIFIGKDYGGLLFSIEEFAKRVLSDNKPGFQWLRNRVGKMELRALAHGKTFDLMRAFLGNYSKDLRYSEHVQLFYDCCHSLGLDGPCWEFGAAPHASSIRRGKTEADDFNNLLELMRSEAKKSQFKRRLRAREHNAKRNFASGRKYQDALFKKYSRLLVLRVDFGYEKEVAEKLTAEDAVRDLNRFLNNKRGKPTLFAPLVGYIAKLEWGQEKKFHIHLILYFDGSKVRQDDFLAKEIGKYWRDLVGGRGTCFNCNAHKSKYKRLGIGLISQDNWEMRNNLLLAVKYLAKNEQYLHAKKIGENTRIFRRGTMPALRTSLAERPRRRRENE